MASTRLTRSSYNTETAEVWLVLLTIDHADLPEPIHVVDNTEPITSGGVEYRACGFEISLPGDNDEGPPHARVRIQNIDQRVGKALRQISSNVSIEIKVVAASDPDTVERSFDHFTLRGVTITVGDVVGSIGPG